MVLAFLAVGRGRATREVARTPQGVPAPEASSLGASVQPRPAAPDPAQAQGQGQEPAAAAAPKTTTVDLSSLPSVPASSEPQAGAAAPAEAHHAGAPHRTPAAPEVRARTWCRARGRRPSRRTPKATRTRNPPFTIDPVNGKKKWKAECL